MKFTQSVKYSMRNIFKLFAKCERETSPKSFSIKSVEHISGSTFRSFIEFFIVYPSRELPKYIETMSANHLVLPQMKPF